MLIDGDLELSVAPVVLSALVLLGVAVAVSVFLGLGVERAIVWAGVRASIQLLAVGFLLVVIFESARPQLLAWLWVVVMVLIATGVLVRRAPSIPRLWIPALLAVLFTTSMALLAIFGVGVMQVAPVPVVVIAGLTIGNAMPSGVGAAKQVTATTRARPGEVEALLALGMRRMDVVRYLAPPAAALALVPQIERTKVVGVIALPGAMAGLLLAGADPVEAVVLQVLVMLIVLGAVALSVLILSVAVAHGTVTAHLRLAPWVTEPDRLRDAS